MWIKKNDINDLSDQIRKAIDGQAIDVRDNKEGPMSSLKNDIHTLVQIKDEQIYITKKERDLLSEYLADISHQLKTPITSMMIMADLLDEAPHDKQIEFAQNIRITLSRMEWLVTTLLKMAKLDSGVIEFRKENVSLRELVQEVSSLLAIMLEVKQQSIILLNDTEIFCDRHWMVEALLNLVKNASEQSPIGSSIYIDGGENPLYKYISIKDEGVGIGKEQYARLFKRFQNSTNEKGYGIGLPLAHSIIKSQNGDIDIEENEETEGTTFVIKFYSV